MRNLFFSAGLAALLAIGAAPASAAPHEEVTQAISRLASASGYVIHIDVPQSGAGGPIEMHHVAPDRYRMMLPGAPAQVIVGNQMYMEMGGRTMSVPIPAGTLDQMQDQAHIREAQENAQIESLGSDALDGKPATKYRIVHADQPDTVVMLWVGSDGLPLQMQVEGNEGVATMRYSRINDPGLVIDAPN